MNNSVQLLVLGVNDRRYALHLAQVDRVVRAVDATPLPHAPAIVWGAIDLHGNIVPVLSMRKRLGLADREIVPDDHFVIAHTSRQSVALVVDDAVGVIERAAEDIISARNVIPRLEQIEGIVRLDDDLLLIHDLDRFLSLGEQQELDAALVEAGDHAN
ncbi:MAG TPA: chemotaxis protein CheW [Tepidisphaeraceae bacterium]|jgi:purine-binding chemotaxis protein CheW